MWTKEAGERLREVRPARMSQLALASAANVSESTVRKMERGDPTVTVGKYRRVVEALGDSELAELVDLELQTPHASQVDTTEIMAILQRHMRNALQEINQLMEK